MTGSSTGASARSRGRRALLWGTLAGLVVALGVTTTDSGIAAAAAAVAQQAQASCEPGEVDAEGHFQLNCTINGLPTVTQTVTVTETKTVVAPTSTPPASPSASSTTAPVPTTPPATTTPTSTTAAPTLPAGLCMPVPSRCGFPDATNTGVPAGTALTVRQGDLTITQPGAVINGLDIRGCVSVRATNVTIRNSRITCGSWYAIGIQAGTGSDPWVAPNAGLLVENVEIVMSSMDMKGIAFDGYTARRVWFHGGSDCAHFGENVTVVDSFCDIPAGRSIGDAHIDGFQSDGGRNIVLRHNTIRVPYSQTSAILMSTNTSPIYDVSIVDNLVAGGGYAIYCGTGSGGPVRGTFTFSGNIVAKTYFAKGGYWGPVTSCPSTGWRWDG